jgi:hypothetical protein
MSIWGSLFSFCECGLQRPQPFSVPSKPGIYRSITMRNFDIDVIVFIEDSDCRSNNETLTSSILAVTIQRSTKNIQLRIQCIKQLIYQLIINRYLKFNLGWMLLLIFSLTGFINTLSISINVNCHIPNCSGERTWNHTCFISSYCFLYLFCQEICWLYFQNISRT